MTIYEIKDRTRETAPYFFSRDSMRFFKQTMRSFHVTKEADGRYLITAKSGGHMTVRHFNPTNNVLEME
jgi:hypothetical protein